MVAAVSILVMYFNHLLCRERCATMLASALLCFQQCCKVVRFGRVFPQACSPVEPVAIEWRAFALHFGMTTNASVSISPQAHSPITKAITPLVKVPITVSTPAIALLRMTLCCPKCEAVVELLVLSPKTFDVLSAAVRLSSRRSL